MIISRDLEQISYLSCTWDRILRGAQVTCQAAVVQSRECLLVCQAVTDVQCSRKCSSSKPVGTAVSYNQLPTHMMGLTSTILWNYHGATESRVPVEWSICSPNPKGKAVVLFSTVAPVLIGPSRSRRAAQKRTRVARVGTIKGRNFPIQDGGSGPLFPSDLTTMLALLPRRAVVVSAVGLFEPQVSTNVC